MKLKVVVDDGLISKDGQGVKIDFSTVSDLPDISNVWAISWDDSLDVPGEMELRNGNMNVPFFDVSSIQFFIDSHAVEVAKKEAAALAIADDIDINKANKLAEIERAARNDILAGFTSDALGTDHLYGGKETDQLNLIGAAAASVDMPFPCADSNEVWARRLHTTVQLRAVVMDGAAYKQHVLVLLDQKRTDIENCVDLDAVNNVVWVQS